MSEGGPPRPSTQGRGRARLLDAARAMFSERGYNGSSTREIADRAGVSEPMLFRHFGNKANLFEAATVEPFVDFMQRYIDDWRSRSRPRGRPALEQAREFYAGLFTVLRAQRELLTALLAAHRFGQVETDIAKRLQTAFREVMGLFEGLLETETEALRFAAADRAAVVRIVVGMVLSVALHDDWLMDDEVDQDRMLDEMSRLTVFGLLRRA